TRLLDGEFLRVQRILPLVQSTVLGNQGGYFPKTTEYQLDRGVMIDQQQQEELDRSLKVAVGDDVDVDLTVPTLEGDKVLATNADGDGLTWVHYTPTVGPQGPQGIPGPIGPAGAGTGDMLKSDNLSGLANNATARTNIGLGALATKTTVAT